MNITKKLFYFSVKLCFKGYCLTRFFFHLKKYELRSFYSIVYVLTLVNILVRGYCIVHAINNSPNKHALGAIVVKLLLRQ